MTAAAKRLRDLDRAATPGPWIIHEDLPGYWEVLSEKRRHIIFAVAAGLGVGNAGIATLRNVLPALADALEDAEAIAHWYDTTHGNGFEHDHHCPVPPREMGRAESCTCGWTLAAPALDRLSADLAAVNAALEVPDAK